MPQHLRPIYHQLSSFTLTRRFTSTAVTYVRVLLTHGADSALEREATHLTEDGLHWS